MAFINNCSFVPPIQSPVLVGTATNFSPFFPPPFLPSVASTVINPIFPPVPIPPLVPWTTDLIGYQGPPYERCRPLYRDWPYDHFNGNNWNNCNNCNNWNNCENLGRCNGPNNCGFNRGNNCNLGNCGQGCDRACKISYKVDCGPVRLRSPPLRGPACNKSNRSSEQGTSRLGRQDKSEKRNRDSERRNKVRTPKEEKDLAQIRKKLCNCLSDEDEKSSDRDNSGNGSNGRNSSNSSNNNNSSNSNNSRNSRNSRNGSSDRNFKGSRGFSDPKRR